MLDNKNGEEPEDDNDTLRYCDPTGVGGTCIFTLIAGQHATRLRPCVIIITLRTVPHGPIERWANTRSRNGA